MILNQWFQSDTSTSGSNLTVTGSCCKSVRIKTNQKSRTAAKLLFSSRNVSIFVPLEKFNLATELFEEVFSGRLTAQSGTSSDGASASRVQAAF